MVIFKSRRVYLGENCKDVRRKTCINHYLYNRKLHVIPNVIFYEPIGNICKLLKKEKVIFSAQSSHYCGI